MDGMFSAFFISVIVGSTLFEKIILVNTEDQNYTFKAFLHIQIILGSILIVLSCNFVSTDPEIDNILGNMASLLVLTELDNIVGNLLQIYMHKTRP